MLRKTNITAMLLATLLAAPTFAAEVTSFAIGGYSWQTEVEGGISGDASGSFSTGSDFLELSMDSFDTDKEANSVLFAELTHTVPYVPNVRISYTQLENSGRNGTYLYPGLSPIGINYGAVNLNHFDITGFYRVWDKVAQVDVGLTGRFIDGELTLQGLSYQGSNSNAAQRIELKTEIALLFARANVDLPLGFALEGELNVGDDGDQRGVDYTLLAKYQSPFGLGIAGGYRKFDAELNSKEDNSIIKEVNTDLTFDGPIFYIFFSF